MKQLFFILLTAIALISSCSPGMYNSTQYGDFYKETKYERAFGKTAETTLLVFKNKTKADKKYWVNGTEITVEAKSKKVIRVPVGINIVTDGFDTINLDAYPFNDWVTVYK